jgi:hypothetical protein
LPGIVLGNLSGPEHGRRRAGHDADHAVGPEGRNALGGVEHSQASAGARAQVNDPPTLGQCLYRKIDRARNLRQRLRDGGRHLAVFTIDEAQDFLRRLGVQGSRRRVFLFGDAFAPSSQL